jgi:dTDP-4-amino-4,6-dideoxygalactose transaminase
MAGAFSFFANKNMPLGEGGMVASDDEALAERVRLLRSHGMTSATWERHRGKAMGYDVVALGFNYRIDEPRAALGSVELEGLDERNAARARICDEYRERLGGVEGASPVMPPQAGADSAHHLFAVVLAEGADRDAVRKAMAADGIQTSLHYPPAHTLSIYEGGSPQLPVTEDYAARAVTLPLFAEMTSAQVEAVVAALAAALDS